MSTGIGEPKMPDNRFHAKGEDIWQDGSDQRVAQMFLPGCSFWLADLLNGETEDNDVMFVQDDGDPRIVHCRDITGRSHTEIGSFVLDDPEMAEEILELLHNVSIPPLTQ